MRNNFAKIAQVSARVRPWVKEIIKRKGYSISEAVTYFAHVLRSNDPKLMLQCKIFFLEDQLEDIRKKKREIIHQENDCLEDLANLKEELSKYGDVIEEPVIVSEEMTNAINRIQRAIDNKKDLLYSPSQTKEEFLNNFISLNGDFVSDVFKSSGKESWSEFKEELVESIEV